MMKRMVQANNAVYGHATPVKSPPPVDTKAPPGLSVHVRVLDSYGGWRTNQLDVMPPRAYYKTQLKDLGVLDIHAACVALQCKQSYEVANTLNALVLASMYAVDKRSILYFPIYPTLLTVMLQVFQDWLLDAGVRDILTTIKEDPVDRITSTMASLELYDEIRSSPFTLSSKPPQDSIMPSLGDFCISMATALHNLAMIPENQMSLATHPLLPQLMLTWLCVSDQSQLEPYYVVELRTLALYFVSSMSNVLDLAVLSRIETDDDVEFTALARRTLPQVIMTFLAHYIGEYEGPNATLTGNQPTILPSLASLAIEAFTKLSNHDNNKRFLSPDILHPVFVQLRSVFFGVMSHPFHLDNATMIDLEYVVLSIYNMVYILPPECRVQWFLSRQDSSMNSGWLYVLLRFVFKYSSQPSNIKSPFISSCIRCIHIIQMLAGADHSQSIQSVCLPQVLQHMMHSNMDDEVYSELDAFAGGKVLQGMEEQLDWMPLL